METPDQEATYPLRDVGKTAKTERRSSMDNERESDETSSSSRIRPTPKAQKT